MTPRCLSTLAPLPVEGCTPAARRRLADGRAFPTQVALRRTELPALRGARLVRMSISGMQDKVSVRLHRGRLEVVDVGGTHILKPIPGSPLPAFTEDAPANEHVTMQLADQVFGLRVAASACLRLADGEWAYVTRRFDRRPDGSRLRQEDFGQLLGQDKYTGSYEQLGLDVGRRCGPGDVVELFRRLVFNYAVANGDAHLRNFSIIEEDGRPRLSPAYDLMCTSLHLPNETALALDLLADDAETGDDWLALARRIGVPPDEARAAVRRPAAVRAEVHALVARSFLTEAARVEVLRRYDDRVSALEYRPR